MSDSPDAAGVGLGAMGRPSAQGLASAGSEAGGVDTSPQRHRAGSADDSQIITVLETS